jgi:hypothetical protein
MPEDIFPQINATAAPKPVIKGQCKPSRSED